MVVRIFARRHLVAVRGRQCRSFSEGKVWRQHEEEGAGGVRVGGEEKKKKMIRSSGIPIRQKPSGLDADFFSAKSGFSEAFARQVPHQGSEQVHPLVLALRAELKSKDFTRSAGRVWSLYLAVQDFHHSSSTGRTASSSSLPVLEAKDHQAVLRAISRAKKRTFQDREAKALVTQRYKGVFSQMDHQQIRGNVTDYLQKVTQIFSQLRQMETSGYPTVDDHDVVLERLAPGGNISAIAALWAHLTGNTSEDFSRMKIAKATPRVDNTVAGGGLLPTQSTYLHLMLGVSRHLSDQITRIHKANLTDAINRGVEKKRARKEKASVQAAAKGRISYGRRVSDQARRAVHLAAVRTVSILDDMLRRQITPNKLTADLALRVLRMDGNMQAIRTMLKTFGVDLANPDSILMRTERGQKEFLRMDVHTLNTIVMAFGEQGTISEMIAAYETLSKPLPPPRMDTTSLSNEGKPEKLFAMDWSVFRRDADVPESNEPNMDKVEDMLSSSSSSSSASSTSKPRFSPNVTTLAAMVKHCCNAPDPTRMLAGLESDNFINMMAKASDHQARTNGEYLGVASYLVTEALDVQERQTAEMARRIGCSMPDVDAMFDQVVSWTEECEREATATYTPRNREGFTERLLEEGKELTGCTVSSDDFIPSFEAPQLVVNYDMLQAIIAHASRRRTADFSRWRTAIAQMQRAMAIKVVELRVLYTAVDKWETLRRQGDYDEGKMTNEALQTLVAAVRKQRRLVRSELDEWSGHFIKHVLARFGYLRQLRRTRTAQRLAKQEALREEAAKTILEDEQRMAREERVKLLEAELRNQHQGGAGASINRSGGHNGDEIESGIKTGEMGMPKVMAAVEPVLNKS